MCGQFATGFSRNTVKNWPHICLKREAPASHPVPRGVPIREINQFRLICREDVKMFVLTINQRDSKESGDRVEELLETLGEIPALVPFQRSIGDEAIGVVQSAHIAVEVALEAIRERRWHIGIGVGPVEMAEGASINTAEGFGLVYARRAVNRAQRSTERIPLAVEGPSSEVAAEAEAVLRLIAQIVFTRTDAEWSVLDLMVPGVRGQQKAIAAALGISTQAVSKAISRSFWNEEWACRPAAARLLDLVAGPTALAPDTLAYNPRD